jgi:hypothetical protein
MTLEVTIITIIGHYILDLSKDENTRGGRALAAISVSEMKLCKAMNVNTSQRGDFIPFRNEKYVHTYIINVCTYISVS